jgi:CysZ protein
MIRSFLRGLLYPLRGLGTILTDARLLGLSAMPTLLGGLLYAAMFWLLWTRLGPWYDALLPPTRHHGLWHEIVEVLRWVVFLGVCALAVMAALLSFVQVTRIAGAPFLDAMSLRAERLVEPGFADPGLGPPVFSAILGEIRKLVNALFWGAVCLLGNLVVPGSGALLGLYLALKFLALDFLDYPMSRRGLGPAQRKAFFRRNLGATSGFALGTLLFLTLPLFGLLAVPSCVVAGTLLFRRCTPPAADPPPRLP